MKWYPKYLFQIVFISILFQSSLVVAQTIDTNVLQSKIDERNNQIKQLELEIKQYNTEVTNAGKQATTLKNTLNTLDLTKKKITTDIKITDSKISKTLLTIDQLEQNINNTEAHIQLNKNAIISALKNTQAIDDIGIIQLVLSNNNISELWTDIDNLRQFQAIIKTKSNELTTLQNDLVNKQSNMKSQKDTLVNLKQDLSGKKEVVESTTKEKATLLAVTKNKEQTFIQLVKTKEEQKAQFEKELYEYESQLHYAVDKGSYPGPRNGVLSWPVDNVFITQRFGRTVGAEKLYTSGSHNGVDFRATMGTRIKNVLDGTVVGSGNTDAYPGCYSFGKWVMVKHDNGLSTIFGHLSVISVSTGDRLAIGDLIGFSGNTGYSTGPHLHISVYATQGVRIEKYVNSIGCKQATMPLADIKAYLDPLAYFPNL
ncbi:peptidoglycan DD-metalloendopeptidase family protein [Patescibacteria group bacterium]|nr:peptidoglycan DD-metalloendopeptidase family protein [Patescibacteria group bacterium]